ncbi:Methyl-accepting chemotaxis protein [Nostoc flagelliforme CCNUN1]|uniref:Methyl-accepting chemotaxis protein n=1 Tax=Nostoc flagelliforme CCNUN1 TaxID=2038116 RepID=A0A2K8T3F6_9NOSO|nr:Methyl-accepting chemotaxis protein [Nostoc flagelliforme CCNUN1]
MPQKFSPPASPAPSAPPACLHPSFLGWSNTSSSPSELGGVKGKGEGGKVLNPLTFPLSPFPRPHLASLGWQTTSLLKPAFLLFDK